MNARSTLLTCILAIIAFSNSKAQVANFTIDSPTGCSPLSVNFTNSSTGSGTLTYNWVLGNGNTSTLKDPKAAYSTPGSYTVKLTVSDGTNSSSVEKSIVVYKNPVANFTANSKGCVPFNISFTDASVKGDANINKWNWDFRNGILKSETNPVISYTSPGTYDVFLEVTDGNGCKSSIEKTDFVDVVDKPMVSFYATPSSSCTVPANIQFTNQSTGGGTLTYAWDFGGGSTSVETNPKHTYTSFGSYNVKLTVTSSYGCSSNMDVPSVTLGEVKAAGTIKQGNTNIVNNSTVCAGDIDFANLSTGTTNCFWDFGDESFSYSPSGKHNYPNAGQYKVKLVAAPGDACADTTEWNITVEKAVAGFIFSPEKACNASNTVAFTNQSSANIVAYKWVFHDASVLTDKDVVKTYIQPAEKDQYEIHETFNYPVKLVVTSTNGCKDSTEQYFEVHQPSALFSVSTVKGCAPLKVDFKDISETADAITSREWQFGNGVTESNDQKITSYTYNTPGTYEVKMTATNASGCKDISPIITVEVGQTVTPDFTVGDANLCSPDKVDLTALPATGVNRWHYTVGGKGVPSCPGVSNPSVYMKTTPGTIDVKLMVDYFGCFSEITKTGAITNDGPSGSFDFTVNCNADRTITLKGNTNNATSFKWEFGDAQINTTDLIVDHVYATENDYTVKFITYKNACSDTFIRVVKMRDHHPDFSLPAEACAGNIVNMNYTPTNISTACSDKFLWDFSDMSQMIRTRNATVGHSFSEGGTYQVKLLTYYDDGCSASKQKSIRIIKPVPSFTVDKKEGCAPLTVTFTDTSTPDLYPINTWDWDFNDNNTVSYGSKQNTVQNIFALPGEYTTELTITDAFGCSATFEQKIATATPTAYFSAISPTQICAGEEVNFLIDYPDPDKAVWNFGNGHTLESIEKPTKYVYPDSGSFDVTLTVYKYGCSEIFTYSKYVQVQKADAKFTASDTAYNCFPRLIKLKHTAGKNNIISGKWYYGHNNNSTMGYLDSTSYNYTEPGIFKAKLEITTSFGCESTFERSLKITGPTGDFTVSPLEACQGDEITYTLTDTAHVHSFEWDLGDGNFGIGNPVKHRYSSVGNRIAKLILYGDKGICKPPAIEDSVHIFEVVSGINVADTSVCEGTTIQFQNTSTGASTYKWNFGDGVNSTIQAPNHLFIPGTYKVSLMTEGIHGCRDTAVQYIIVSKIPSLAVSQDTIICLGGTAMLRAASDKDVRWEPVTDLSSSTIPNPLAAPKQNLNYVVYATDAFSKCFKKDSVFVTVQQKPTIELVMDDSTIVAGRPVQITANTEEGATFEWSPADFLSCTNCFDPISTARTNTSYVLKVVDKNKCFTVEKTVNLVVDEGVKAFDVPSAFTPSGSEPNNVFRVQGYNVKQLLEFKIYNRWGNLVFSSNDLSRGWDGTYQGKAQPVDSYVFTIKIETFDGRTETRTGTILLLR